MIAMFILVVMAIMVAMVITVALWANFMANFGQNSDLNGLCGIGYWVCVSAHDLSGYKVLGVEYQNKVVQCPVAKI